ncbi:MAG: hypothetical protein AAFR47_18870 [Pseudomonadota bacterium]
MHCYIASLLLPVDRQLGWRSGHLSYLPKALYTLGLFSGRRNNTRD